ncbi:MAG: alpha-hydroxy-acid oxidizing protein [Pseudolabrys sp.]|nr:alpha-hydroxy-acid oxidizing protein [Pseudolabrys sp.]
MDSYDLDQLEKEAETKLPPPSWAFCVTGADDEITSIENVSAWRNLRLRPRVLNDISKAATETTVLGQKIAAPILIAPTGRHKLFHPQGERETARGAALADAVYVMATSANVPLEEVAKERKNAPQWFQLYLFPEHDEVERLIDRVAAAGFTALALTVDNQVYGWSPRQARIPFEPRDDIRNVNMPGQPMARTAYDASFRGKVVFPTTWRELEWLVKRSPIPVICKGVMRGDDARRCVDLGAKAVMVSNHGGRHLDTTITTAQALPDVVDAVKGRAEVYVDGGIRRGTDVVKALALGARAVMVGRPPIWGLAVNGAEGVAAVMRHLQEDLLRAMQLCGIKTPSEAARDLVAS